LNGNSACAVGPHMVVPIGKGSQTDFYFYQSSNRMAIECAFGILIRRSALLFNHTHTHSKATAPFSYLYFLSGGGSFGANLRWPTRDGLRSSAASWLHKFCIDHLISEEHLAAMDGNQGLSVLGEVGVPSRWEKKATFDRDGRPVDYLN
jgi:hypothetical protein